MNRTGRVGGFGTSLRQTESIMKQAKARALAAIDQSNPKLTALERAYWVALRKNRRQTNNTIKAS